MAKASDPKQRITELLESYGARTELWPAEDRALLRLPSGKDAEVMAAVEEARDVDRILDGVAVPFPNAKLVSALVTIPSRHPRNVWSLGAPWQRAAAAVLLLVTGLVLGRLTPLMAEQVTAANDDFGAVVGELLLGPELSELEVQ